MDQVITTQITVNGETRAASNGAVYDLFNPARPSELVGHAAAATQDDMNAAVEAAHAAFPTWAALGFQERAKILRGIAAALTGPAHRQLVFRPGPQAPQADQADDNAKYARQRADAVENQAQSVASASSGVSATVPPPQIHPLTFGAGQKG